jgi:hypothetical protein
MAEHPPSARNGDRNTADRYRDRLARYLLFTVSFSFFPILCLFLVRAYNGHYMSVRELVDGGQPLGIAVVLAAEAMGTLLATGRQSSMLRATAVAVCLSTIVCWSILLALQHDHPATDPTGFTDFSVAALLVSITTATFGKVLAGYSE